MRVEALLPPQSLRHEGFRTSAIGTDAAVVDDVVDGVVDGAVDGVVELGAVDRRGSVVVVAGSETVVVVVWSGSGQGDRGPAVTATAGRGGSDRALR